jgi:hypothetical protein
MARIKIARGSKANLPADLMYGELYWEKEQAGTSDGVLVMGHPDGAAKDPMPIAGARAMKSLYFEGLWDASAGTYPTGAQVGSFYVASADGTGPAATFKYGDWAICIAVNGDGSTQWIKAINQAITTEDPLGLSRNPLDLTAGVIKLKYASDTLEINSEGKLAVKTYESFALASGVIINSAQAVALNSTGEAIIADNGAESTAIVVGFAQQSDAGSVDVQKFGRMTNAGWSFSDIGGPVYLGAAGALIQDVSVLVTGNIAIQVGTAINATTLEIGIGTPYKIELGSDIYYIPLTQSITAGDVAHAPSSDAIYQFMFGTGVSPSFTGLKVSGDILPDVDNLRNVGSADLRFANIWVNEVHVGAHSLYVNGKKTIEDASNIMTFSTDEDQAIMMKTTASVPGSGAGSISLQSANQLNVTAIGGATFTVPSNVNLKNIVFNNQSSGGNIQFQAANELSLIAPSTKITGPLQVTGDATIGGALTMTGSGTNFAVNNTILKLNQSQTGTPADTLVAGLEVNRGNPPNYRFAYVEHDQNFQVGMVGQMQPVATREAAPVASAVGVWDTANIRFSTASNFTFASNVLYVPEATLTGKVTVPTIHADFLAPQTNGQPIALTGDLTISGQLTVNGTTTTVNSTTVNIEDNIIQVNASLTGAPPSNLQGGISVNRGSGTAYQFLYDEITQSFRVGQIGSLQAVATRQDMPTANAIPYWNDTAKRLDSSGVTVSGNVLTGSLVGSASSWTNARTITLDGDLSGSVSINGTADVTLTAAVLDDSHGHTNATLPAQASGATGTGFVAYNGTTGASGKFDGGSAAPSAADTTQLNYTGIFTASKVYNAVWNDIVDFLEVDESTQIYFGKVYVADEDEHYKPSTKYLDEGIIGLVSDTYGFGVGHNPEKKQLPIAIGGFVLAEVDQVYRPGTPLTASADGRLTEIKPEDKREYPERIVATFLKAEKAEEWNGINVRGRHWVRVR